MPFFTETLPAIWEGKITNGSGTGNVALTDAEGYSRQVDAITVVNNDGISHGVLIWISYNSFTFVIGAGPVPAGTGVGSTPSLNLLTIALPSTITSLALPGGAQVLVSVNETVTGGAFVQCTALGGRLGS